MKSIRNFLDSDGRIKLWPAKKEAEFKVLEYLSGKFEPGRIYTERDVNTVIQSWHTFGDLFLLRRALVDFGLMTRTRNGARYWREETACRGAVAGAVSAYFDVGPVRSILGLTGGYGAATYYVQAGNGDYILKDVEQNGMNHPENEAQVLDVLRKSGIPVPEIIAGRGGGTLVRAGEHTYQMHVYAEGRVYQSNTAPVWLLSESARLLGRIHECLQTFPPLPEGIGKGYFSYHTPERAVRCHTATLQQAMCKNDTDIVGALEEKLGMIGSLPRNAFEFEKLTCKNTHGDYKIQHLVCRKDMIAAVIDFTAACRHPVCFELFRSYCLAAPECAEGIIDIDSLKKYIACYLESASLSDADLKSMPSLYYYQNVVADYFGQFYAMEQLGRNLLLKDAYFSLRLCRWLQRNMTVLEDALTRGF